METLIHPGGSTIDLGSVILLSGLLLPIAVCIVGFFSLYIFASFIASGVKAKRQLKSSGQIEEELSQTERKAEEEWRLPPELALPPPRPVRSAPLRTRLWPRLTQVVIALVLATFIFYIFGLFEARLHRQGWQGLIWLSLVLAFLAGFLLHEYSEGRKDKRLLQWGVSARGKILSLGQGQGTAAWNFEFHDAAGNLVKTLLPRNSRTLRGPIVVTVLYDPENPHRFITYPVKGYEVTVPETI